MPENGNGQPQQDPNQAPTPEDLETIKAQLEEEKTARQAAEEQRQEVETTLAAAQSHITELESALSEAKSSSEASAAELAQVTEARDQAVAKYVNMAKALNPSIPEGIIAGESIQEIDSSVEKGKAIVEAVKKAMEAEAAQAKVPAGAPTRGGAPTEGMTSKEKIAYAIQQKGGTS